MKVSCKNFIFKTHVDQPFYSLFTLYYKSFLGIRVTDYYNSYSQAEEAKVNFFGKL